MAADLRASRAALPAPPERPAPDPAVEKTQPQAVPPGGAPSDPSEVRTVPLQPAPSRSATSVAGANPDATTHARVAAAVAADAGLEASTSAQRYPISRKFDASATLLKLAAGHAAGHDTAATFGAARKRWFRNRDHLLLAIAMLLAVIAAAAIALG
jgi:hypothetical protein